MPKDSYVEALGMEVLKAYSRVLFAFYSFSMWAIDDFN